MTRTSQPSRDEPVSLAPGSNGGPPHGTHAESSATEAIEHVLHAGQRLVSEGIELVTLDAQEVVAEKLSAGRAILLPCLLAFVGWWMLMAALVAFLDTYLVLPASLAIVAGANLLAGAGLTALAVRGATTRKPLRHGSSGRIAASTMSA